MDGNNKKNNNSKEDLFLKYWNKVGCCVCTRGEADLLIDSQSHHLQRGTLYMITPLIQIQQLSPSSDFECINLMDDVKVFFPTFHQIIDSGIPLYIREHPCWQITEEDISFVQQQHLRIANKRELLAQTRQQFEKAILFQQIQLITKETVIELIFNHFHSFSFSLSQFSRQSHFIYQFIITLLNHYKTERTVNFYAEKAQLSPNHFTHVVRTATGKTPSEWITLFTITYAKYLLDKSELIIKEIAEELHFPEQFTFRKYFKKHTGMAPKEYRNRKR